MEYKLALKHKSLRELKDLGYEALADHILSYTGPGSQGGYLSDSVNSALTWNRTPQGQNFWSYVYDGDFERARQDRPEWAYLLVNTLDKIAEDRLYKVQSNGLLKTT